MPEYKVETLCSMGNIDIEQFKIMFDMMVEDKISEYVQNGYSLFSHQMSIDHNGYMIVQIVFIKED